MYFAGQRNFREPLPHRATLRIMTEQLSTAEFFQVSSLRRAIFKNRGNEKADLKSAFGVCPRSWVNHPLHFIRNPL